MLNKKRLAGTKAQQSTNDEVTTSSHTIGKPNVGCSTSSNSNDKINKILSILKGETIGRATCLLECCKEIILRDAVIGSLKIPL